MGWHGLGSALPGRGNGGGPGRRRVEQGAAAVEFALVSFIFFPLLFGIIDYGLWFNDSLNVRQGVREAARMGVVKSFSDPDCTSGNDMQKLDCITKDQIGAITGPTYVKLVLPGGWTQGEPLVVCAMVKSKGVTGIVPLPNNRIIYSKTEMSIESASTPPSGVDVALPADPLPGGFGADWSWCS